MKSAFLSSILFALLFGFAGCTTAGDPLFQEKDVPVLPEVVEGELIDYATQIQPIFDAKCTMCHGASGGLDLSSHAATMAGGANGDSVIPCDGAGSFLYEKVFEDTPSLGLKMPLTGSALTESELLVLELWIDEGANEVPTENSCSQDP